MLLLTAGMTTTILPRSLKFTTLRILPTHTVHLMHTCYLQTTDTSTPHFNSHTHTPVKHELTSPSTVLFSFHVSKAALKAAEKEKARLEHAAKVAAAAKDTPKVSKKATSAFAAFDSDSD